MNCKIDIDRFICDLFSIEFNDDEKERIRYKCESRSIYAPLHVALMAVCKALKNQGLFIKDGQLEEIRGKQEKISPNQPLTEEQKPVTTPGSYDMKLVCLSDKPQTIKFNKERLMEIEKPESIEKKYNIDIDKMVEEYKEEVSKVLLPLGFNKGNIEHLSIAYKNGIEDMLKLIKEGGSNESID